MAQSKSGAMCVDLTEVFAQAAVITGAAAHTHNSVGAQGT
jgi:hypothetical protein